MPIEFEQVQGNVVFVRVTGKLTDADYKETFVPVMERAIERWTSLRMLFIMDEAFEGWDLHAGWDELMFEFKHHGHMVKVGVVGGARWEQIATRLSAVFTGANVRFFAHSGLDEAKRWVTSGF